MVMWSSGQEILENIVLRYKWDGLWGSLMLILDSERWTYKHINSIYVNCSGLVVNLASHVSLATRLLKVSTSTIEMVLSWHGTNGDMLYVI
jgi:hypothetical protein